MHKNPRTEESVNTKPQIYEGPLWFMLLLVEPWGNVWVNCCGICETEVIFWIFLCGLDLILTSCKPQMCIHAHNFSKEPKALLKLHLNQLIGVIYATLIFSFQPQNMLTWIKCNFHFPIPFLWLFITK